MAAGWKTVRVFISSTFRDMHAERDYLVRFVIPELQERCATRQLHLVPVDLRWGVTEEEAEQGRTLALCLDAIDACRPFFIGLLGERYGWVPDTYAIPDEPRYHWMHTLPPGYSVTALEIAYGVLRDPAQAQGAFFYFRDAAFLQDRLFLTEVPRTQQEDFTAENEEAKAKLAQLKQDIRRQCQGQVYEQYPCTYAGRGVNGEVKLAGLERFGNRVLEDLWSAIEHAYPVGQGPLDAAASERTYHDAFLESRCQGFLGRHTQLQQLVAYAQGRDLGPCAVLGPPGSGKSALLAQFAQTYAEAHPDVFVVPFFIGVSPGSTDIRSVLLRLCRELASHFSLREAIPQEYVALQETFAEVLAQAASRQKIVLVLDALDQLDPTHHAHELGWLPHHLPPDVRLVVSLLEGPYWQALQQRSPLREVQVGILTRSEQHTLVTQQLESYGKHLDERPGHSQMETLLSKREAGTPLYLVVACEELRIFGEFEQVTKRIADLAEDLPSLFQQVLERLESDHGKAFVTTILSLLSCSHDGLFETEVLELLRRDGEEQLPQAIWAPLYRNLHFYLRPPGDDQTGRLAFFHQQLAKAVQQRYLTSETAVLEGHKKLAAYFRRKADPTGDGSWATIDPRGLAELPYQQTHGRIWDELYHTLTDSHYLERRTGLEEEEYALAPGLVIKSFSGIYSLQGDFERALGQEGHRQQENEGSDLLQFPVRDPRRKVLTDFYETMRREAHFLSEHPDLLWQQLYNDLQWAEDPTRKAVEKELRQRRKQPHPPWLRHVLPTHNVFGAAQSLSHRLPLPGRDSGFWLEDCAVSADGTWMLSCGHGFLIVWDVATGERRKILRGGGQYCAISPDDRWFVTVGGKEVSVREAATWEVQQTFPVLAEEEEDHVRAAALSGNGSQMAIVTGKFLSIWNLQTGKLETTLLEHEDGIDTCIFSPDGSLFVCSGVSPAASALLKIWETRTWELLQTIACPFERVSACAVSPDNTWLVTTTHRGQLKMWDISAGLERGEALTHMEYYGGMGVKDCAISPDGTQIVSVGRDGLVKRWDVQTRKQIGPALKGHSSWIVTCAWSANGRLLVSGDTEGILRVWDLQKEPSAFDTAGHQVTVNACAISPDGEFFLTAGEDHTLRIWNSATGKELHALSPDRSSGGFRGEAIACAIAPDSSFIVSVNNKGCLYLWDGTKAWKQRTIEENRPDYTEQIDICAVSSDGRFIVANFGYDVRIFDAPTWAQAADLRGHRDFIISGAISPDSSWFATGDRSGIVKVWNALSGTERATLQDPEKEDIGACAISPDGAVLVSANGGSIYTSDYSPCRINIWNTDAWEHRQILAKDLSGVIGCAVTPDGRSLVAACQNGTIRLWEMSTGEEQATLLIPGVSSRLTCLALHPWLPSLLCCGAGGVMYFLELEEITYSRLIVTAREQGGTLGVYCPVCSRKIVLTQDQLGQALDCPQGDCQMHVNPFIVQARPIAQQPSHPSEKPVSRWWWRFVKRR